MPTARGESEAENSGGGSDAGQVHSAGGAVKKGLKPAVRRELVRQVRQVYRLSERRACGLFGITRWTNRYQSRRDPQTELGMRLRELAGSRTRYGYRRLTVLLRREGWMVNAKRVNRLYRAEALQVRTKKRAKRAAQVRAPLIRHHRSEPTLEHGFRERSASRWALVRRFDSGGSVHAGMPVCFCGPPTERERNGYRSRMPDPSNARSNLRSVSTGQSLQTTRSVPHLLSSVAHWGKLRPMRRSLHGPRNMSARRCQFHHTDLSVLADRSDRFSIQGHLQPPGISYQSGHSGRCSDLLVMLL